MENENTATSGAVAENVNGVAQEVSSTTQPVEPTKRSLRVQTWKRIEEKKFGVGFNAIFNRIPCFVGSDKAATLLANTDEFKNAHNIKVNIDRTLHAVKLQVLLANKTLYLPGMRQSTALFLKVDVPAEASEEEKNKILNIQDIDPYRTEISVENKVKLDMVVIGSVVVSRDGYRIGRGNGFADLDIGILTEVGSITPETVIVTVVHDIQVVDSLPTNLFQKFDTPVDLIVTPTEVIRVTNRLPRTKGIYWELLSERRLKLIPVLRVLKEQQEKDGKIIVLKEEDTDIEQNSKNRRPGQVRRQRFTRRNQRRAVSQTDTEQQADNQQQRRNMRRPRRFVNRRRRPTKSEGDQSGVESKSQERKPFDKKQQQQQQQQRHRKSRLTSQFCIKLSNISRDVRVKDLKSELRRRNCNPSYISWKAYYGTCYLHFGHRNGTENTESDINKVLEMLNDLSLTVTTGGGGAGNSSGAEGDAAPPQPMQTKTVNVNVELIKFDEAKKGNQSNGENVGVGDTAGTRIESVDTTTV